MTASPRKSRPPTSAPCIWAALLFLLVGFSAQAFDHVDWDALDPDEIAPGELLIGLRDGVQAAAMLSLHQSIGATSLRHFDFISTEHVRVPAGLPLKDIAALYAAHPMVAFVEPNFKVYPMAIPNDPLYSQLYGMTRINAPQAWDITTGNEDFVVAVIDTGILLTHLDLKDNLWINPGETGLDEFGNDKATNGIDDDGNGYIDDVYGWDFFNDTNNPNDRDGHGTHVAGTIGGVGDNAIGVAGVNWRVKVAALKFLDPFGFTADAIAAVNYCRIMNFQLSNNSWGGGPFSQALKNAIERAGAEANHLFVAAAGNSSLNTDLSPAYPASYDSPNLLSVAAIDSRGSLAFFSNFGATTVDLGAPGVDILSSVVGAPANNAYDSYSGTSMAAPHVAGAAALMWGLNPDLPYAEVRDAILAGARPNPALDGITVTGGELDLFASIRMIGGAMQFDSACYPPLGLAVLTVTDANLADDVDIIEVLVELLDGSDPARPVKAFLEIEATRLPGDVRFEAVIDLAGFAVPPEHDDILRAVYAPEDGSPSTAEAVIDAVPAVLFDLEVVEVSDDAAVLRWKSDEEVTTGAILSTVLPPGGLAGLPVSFTSEAGGTPDGAFFSHSLRLTELTSTSRYYVAIIAEDCAGNESSLPVDLTSSDANDYLQLLTLYRKTVYENRMEDGPLGWTIAGVGATNVWQLGKPVFGPGSAYSGDHAWGTVLTGRYSNLVNAWVQSPPVGLSLFPRLEFQSWHQMSIDPMGPDEGFVEVNKGTGWINVTGKSPDFTGTSVFGTNAEWRLVSVDLREFKNTSLATRFRLNANEEGRAAGWYIDDLVVSDVTPPGLNIVGYRIDDTAGGDGDGFPEPGEDFLLEILLYNSVLQTWTNVQATFETPVSGISLPTAQVSLNYGHVAPGAVNTSGSMVPVSVDASLPDGTVASFFHSTTAANGGPWIETLRIPIATRETVRGRVSRWTDDAPIAGATVEGYAPGMPLIHATTDAAGLYALHGAVPGIAYEVSALQPGAYSRSEARSVVAPAANIDFALGVATANPSPTSFSFVVPQGGSEEAGLALSNESGDLPLEYSISIEYDAVIGDWLDVLPASGVLPAGDAETLAVSVDADGIPPSSFSAIIRIAGNDVGGVPIEIPVTLEVLAAPNLSVAGVLVEGGDGDRFAEPGETVDLNIELANSGSQTAEDVMGQLVYVGEDGMATVSSPDAEWDFIFPFSSAEPFVPPTIQISPAVGTDRELAFLLNLVDADANEWSLPFSITTDVKHAISGTIRDLASAEPVEGARVEAKGLVTRSAVSAEDGTYEIQGLEDGAYTVTVRPPLPYARPPAQSVGIAGANVFDVDFDLAAWEIGATPGAISVTIQEGQSTNVTLTVTNKGPVAGHADISVELIEGIGAPLQAGLPEFPPVDWAGLNETNHVPRQLLVLFEPGADAASRQSALGIVGARTVQSYTLIPAVQVEVPGNLSLQQVAAVLEADPSVRRVEPNYMAEPSILPDDPFFPDLYALQNLRQTGGTLGADINATSAWDLTVGDRSVIVAVVDTGIAWEHPDLVANIWTNFGEVGLDEFGNDKATNGIDDDGNGFIDDVVGYDFGRNDNDPRPDFLAIDADHGTHVAGTIGARGDNGIGVVGVNWDIQMIATKASILFFDPFRGVWRSGLPNSATIAALEYAVDQGAKISNHSYGGMSFSGIEYAAIQAAADADHLLICAAGNSGMNSDLFPLYPAAYNLPNIISVAAADHHDQLADFSNYGLESVDLAAPGVDILSTVSYDESHFYESKSGTSMAAPHVAGAAALLRAVAPGANREILRQALLDGVRRDVRLEGKVASGGHLDIGRALELIQALWLEVQPDRIELPAFSSGTLAASLNLDGRLPAGSYSASILLAHDENGLRIPVTLTVLPAPQPHVVSVTIADMAGGDGDGFAEPGETLDLRVRLGNRGSALLPASTGFLSTTASGVTIQDATSAWPGILAGLSADPLDAFTVTFGAAPMPNPVPFTFTVNAGSQGPYEFHFEVSVEPRRSVTGTVRDRQTTAGLPGVPVEFWGAAAGSVLTDASGAFRIDGLAPGAYRVRALPVTHEVSETADVLVNVGDVPLDLTVGAPAVSLGTQHVTLALPVQQDEEVPLLITNASNDPFTFRLIELPALRAAVICDGTQLVHLPPVLESLGMEVSLFTNNAVRVLDPESGREVDSGQYSGDGEVVFNQDLVIADLSGPRNGGRLLSAEEASVLEEFLSRGGRLILTGPQATSLPDDPRRQQLLGLDSFDRDPDVAELAEATVVLPRSDFVEVRAGERLGVARRRYDLASIAPDVDAEVFFQAGSGNKLLRHFPEVGGAAYLWNGNQDGSEWEDPGVWRDILLNLLLDEFVTDVPWLDAGPLSASVAADSVEAVLRLDAGGLAPGVHEAVLLVLGNFAGRRMEAVRVTFDVRRTTLRAESNPGVVDWLGQPLPGSGGGSSALFQLIYAGPNGLIDPPSADGRPGGDDRLLRVFPTDLEFGRIGVGYEHTVPLGRFAQSFLHDLRLTTPVRDVYVRAWDRSSFADSVAYGDSPLYSLQVTVDEAHDFGAWVVEQVVGYPGFSARDTNQDSVPDGWYIRNGMDPRLPIGPLTAQLLPLSQWGEFGTANGQFRFPARLALSDDFVFVLDRQNNRIQTFGRDTGAFLASFGTTGTGSGQFTQPRGLARIPGENRLVVADTGNHRIQLLSFNPASGMLSFESAFGAFGTGTGQFRSPHDVAVDSLGNLYVADTDNHRVQVFTQAGTLVSAFGVFGSGVGQLKAPKGIDVDEQGLVVVADTDNHRLQAFSAAGSSIWRLGAAGTASGQFDKPNGVAVDRWGRIFVADTGNHRVQVFNALRNHVASLGALGSAAAQLRFPEGITPVDGTDRLYVVDTWNHRIQRFRTILDGDGDGMDDTWEELNGLNSLDPSDALIDSDGDGLLNIGEFRIRTNPQLADTDGDGLNDRIEVWLGLDPLDPSVSLHRLVAIEGPGPVRLRWSAQEGGIYAVQVATRLEAPADWTELVAPSLPVTAAEDGLLEFEDPHSDFAGLRFYRVVRLNP